MSPAEARVLETLVRLFERHLKVMNEAVGMTAEQGPAAAVQWIADYLNDTDGVDEDLVAATPSDWPTRWSVSRKAGAGDKS